MDPMGFVVRLCERSVFHSSCDEQSRFYLQV